LIYDLDFQLNSETDEDDEFNLDDYVDESFLIKEWTSKHIEIKKRAETVNNKTKRTKKRKRE